MLKKLILIITIFLNLLSCITYSSNNRGSLSDAMDKAKDENKNNREVPSYNNEDNDDFISWGSNKPDPGSKPPPNNSSNRDNSNSIIAPNGFLMFRSGLSLINGPYFDFSTTYEVLYGGADDPLTSYLYCGLELLHINDNNDIVNSIASDPGTIYGGLEFRYYPIINFKYFSPYLIGRIGGIYMLWDYKNNIVSNGDVIKTDTIGGLTLDIGVGIDIIHTKKIRFGVQCKPQGYLYGIQTYQGFNNDYFSPSGNIMLSAEFGINF